MLPMFRKSFWVPYPEDDVYPTVSKAGRPSPATASRTAGPAPSPGRTKP